MSELNDTVNITVDDATVITVPLVTNLTATNAAPTAKTVGDALAAKVDTDTIMEHVTIKVNEESSDNQGQILLDGSEIPLTDGNSTSVAGAIAAVDAKTANEITYSGAQTIKAKIESVETEIAASGNKTASDITYDSTAATPVTIKAKVDAIQTSVDNIGTENVRYTQNQGLNDTQKGYARDNIGAASAADVTALQAAALKFVDVTFDQGFTLQLVGQDANTITITPSMAGGVDFATATIYNVSLTWAWPMTGWEYGAVVTINNVGIVGSNLTIHLATTCAQTYMLKFRILYA